MEADLVALTVLPNDEVSVSTDQTIGFIDSLPVHTGERALSALTSIFSFLANMIAVAKAPGFNEKERAAAGPDAAPAPPIAPFGLDAGADFDAMDTELVFKIFAALSGLASKIHERYSEDIAARYRASLTEVTRAVASVGAGGAVWEQVHALKNEAIQARAAKAAEAARAAEAAEAARAAEEAAAAAAAEAEAAGATQAEAEAAAAAAAAAAKAAADEEAAKLAAAAAAAKANVAAALSELQTAVKPLQGKYGSLLNFSYLLPEPVLDIRPYLLPSVAEGFGATPAEQGDAIAAAIRKVRLAEEALPAYEKLHSLLGNIFLAYPDDAAAAAGNEWHSASSVGAVFSNMLGKFRGNIKLIRERLDCEANTHLTACKLMKKREETYERIAEKAGLAKSALEVSESIGTELPDVPAADPAADRIGAFVSSHLNFMDSLFSVRTVVNFRTEFPPTAGGAAAGADYTEVAQGNMRNMLKLEAGADMSVYKRTDSDKTEFQNIFDVSDPSVQYGPFFRVITDSSGLDVSKDMTDMFSYYTENGAAGGAAKPKHYMYSGYGYSGSGKTFALLTNPNGKSVLHQIAKAIQAANDARTASGASPYEVKCYAYDYYGEIPDAGCAEIAPDPKISDLTNPKAISVADLTFFKVSKPTPDAAVVCTPESQDLLSEDGKSLAKIQATAESNAMTLADLAKMYAKPDAAGALGALSETITDYRKRTDFAALAAAPGSEPDSAPQKYHIRATPNNDESSRSHFFIDMYIMDGANPVGRATVLDMAGSEKVSTIQEDYFSIVPLNAVKTINDNEQIAKQIKDLLVATIRTGAQIQSFSAVKPEPWIALRSRFVALAPSAPVALAYPDIVKLVLLNNAYNYLLVCFQYEKVFNAYRDRAKKSYATTIVAIEAFTLPTNPSQYHNAAKFIRTSWQEHRKNYANAIARAESDALGAFALTEEDVAETLSTARRLAQMPSDPVTIAEKEAELKAEIARMDAIKAKYHCPIRYQGNFINASLHWLKLYVSDLANGTSPAPQQAADVFTNTLMRQSLNGAAGDGAPAPAFDRKFVLMTNIRLDFDKDDDTDARRKNYRDAATVSLQFAHCINPFASKSAGHYECLTEEELNRRQADAAAKERLAMPPPTAPAASKLSTLPPVRPSSAALFSSKAAAQRKADTEAAAAAAAKAAKRRQLEAEKIKLESAKRAAALVKPLPVLPRAATPASSTRSSAASKVKQQKPIRRGGAGAYDPTAETSLAHVQALGLVVLFALSIGLAERTTSPTRQRLRIGSAPPPALVRAGFTVAFLIFYTLTTLIWATLGVVRFGAYLLHLLFFYTLVATFAGVLFKNKSQAGSILLSFVLSLTAFFADA